MVETVITQEKQEDIHDLTNKLAKVAIDAQQKQAELRKSIKNHNVKGKCQEKEIRNLLKQQNIKLQEHSTYHKQDSTDLEQHPARLNATDNAVSELAGGMKRMEETEDSTGHVVACLLARMGAGHQFGSESIMHVKA